MKCPKCQTENPKTRKFCKECGAKLILVCPNCHFENLPWDKFCREVPRGQLSRQIYSLLRLGMVLNTHGQYL